MDDVIKHIHNAIYTKCLTKPTKISLSVLPSLPRFFLERLSRIFLRNLGNETFIVQLFYSLLYHHRSMLLCGSQGILTILVDPRDSQGSHGIFRGQRNPLKIPGTSWGIPGIYEGTIPRKSPGIPLAF